MLGFTSISNGIAKNDPVMMPNCSIMPPNTPAYFLCSSGDFSKDKINDPSALTKSLTYYKTICEGKQKHIEEWEDVVMKEDIAFCEGFNQEDDCVEEEESSA